MSFTSAREASLIAAITAGLVAASAVLNLIALGRKEFASLLISTPREGIYDVAARIMRYTRPYIHISAQDWLHSLLYSALLFLAAYLVARWGFRRSGRQA